MGRAPDGTVVGRRRVGIFGGTFDPPHDGHVSVVRDVADALDLDEVLWMPAGEPPHKPDAGASPIAVRLAMTRAAAAADPRFRVSELEIGREGPSYTVDTLRELRAGDVSGGTDLFLIIGIDQYRAFDSWRAPDEIRVLAHVTVMDRGGTSLEGSETLEGVVSVPVRRIDISSTEVRARAREGRDVSDLVPPAVARIIESEGLYRGRAGGPAGQGPGPHD